ncbi:L-proline cis-3-hydroxylase [Nocardia sp. NPDC051321]|uniref:L-proline cis-3-hydroxylase n=1 Tax=Nocardia sp. NPDC051321 TaxID=3364323 RepID=UPI00378BF435
MRSHVIARIDLDNDRLEPDLEYLAMVPRLEEEYDEFASGYWKNLSLANSSGNADDSAYRDIVGSAITTDHGRNTPYLTNLVETVFDRDRVKMVRARNLIDAIVVPHRDFVDLEQDNDTSIFADRSTYRTDVEPDIRARRPFTDDHKERLLSLSSVIDRRNFKDILFLLSKVHYDYEVSAEHVYPWLSQICRSSGDELLAAKSDMLAGYMIDARALTERFSINGWAS